MRRSHTLGLTLGCLAITWLVPDAIAQQANPARFREMFLQLDANGDTVLEREEIPESGRAAFDRLLKRGDTNKNNKLEAEELRELGQKLTALAESPQVALARFERMDKDKDGKVSKEEFTGLAANFDRIDADKDGNLTKDEITTFFAAIQPNGVTARAKAAAKKKAAQKAKTDDKSKTDEAPKPKDAPAKPAPAAPGPLQRFKALDKDGDGKLSKEEFPRAGLFDRLDGDKDGFLTREELAKFRKPGT